MGNQKDRKVARKATEERNVILITIDCLRSDHLSCYGYERKTSPNIDKLAEGAMLFKQALSNGGHTRIAFPVLFTSTYFFSNRFLKRTNGRFVIRLFGDVPYLPEILKRNGYKTAGFHSNPFLAHRYGYDRGFDIIYDPLEKKRHAGKKDRIKLFLRNHIDSKGLPYRLLKLIHNKLKLIHNKFTSPCPQRPFAGAEEITNNALSWIKNNKDDPFFIWTHYMDVHHPYRPPKECLMKFCDNVIPAKKLKTISNKMLRDPDSVLRKDIKKLINLYDGCINYVDNWIGKFLSAIEDMNLLDNSMIILTADHGEAFGEHGDFLHGERRANLYEEIVRVPIIISAPDIEGGERDAPVSLLDIGPTILDYLSIQKLKCMQGESLLKCVERKEDIIFSESLEIGGGGTYIDPECFGNVLNESIYIKERGVVSCRTENWKYIYRANGLHELYNLKVSPEEHENVINKETKRAREFKSKVLQHMMIEEISREKSKEKDRVRSRIKELRRLGKL